jgi:SAM-dependent methyltransferase
MTRRVLIIGKIFLVLTAGIHSFLWQTSRPPPLGDFGATFPIGSGPRIEKEVHPTKLAPVPNLDAVSFLRDQAFLVGPGRVKQVQRRVQPCGSGAFFDRRKLTRPTVITIPSKPASHWLSTTLLPSASTLRTGPSHRIGAGPTTKHCLSQLFNDCNMTLLERMGDLLSNGSFVKGTLSFKRTGENAIVDPQEYRRYFLAFECIGVYKPEGDTYASADKWEHRVGSKLHLHPVLSPLHGGVSPARLIGQARYLLSVAEATPILQILDASPAEVDLNATAAPSLNGKTFGILEFGCGHGALLASMCPPVTGVHCHGSDFSPKLVEAGMKHFPWMQLEANTAAPSVATGSIDLAISHAVLSYIPEEAVCNHLLEGLRVLRPGGKFILWMLWATPFGAATRLHPGFFVAGVPWDQLSPSASNFTFNGSSLEGDSHPSQERYLPFCSANIGLLVDQVQLWLADPSAPIYSPSLNRGGPYGVVLRRAAAGSGEQRKDVANTTHPSTNLDGFKGRTEAGAQALRDYLKWHRQYSTFRKFDKRSRQWVAESKP